MIKKNIFWIEFTSDIEIYMPSMNTEKLVIEIEIIFIQQILVRCPPCLQRRVYIGEEHRYSFCFVAFIKALNSHGKH